MLNFATELTDVGGNLIITSQTTLPTFNSHDPLSQIWGKVKLKIEKLYQMKPCATIQRPVPGTTVISIFPNWAYHEAKCPQMDERLYAQRFKDTFELQVQEFEDAILAWIDDTEFGLPAYEHILELNSPIVPGEERNSHIVEQLELLTDDFLARINLRKPNRAQRKRDISKQRAQRNLRCLQDAATKRVENPDFDDAS